jgi:hypothetical protein
MLTEKSILHAIKIASILTMFSLVFFHVYDMRIVLSLGLIVVISHAMEVKNGYHVYQKGEILLKILMLLVMGGMYVYFRFGFN